MAGLVSRALNLARAYAGPTAWHPLVRLSRQGVLALLQRIRIGQLLIIEKDGVSTLCGQSSIADLVIEPKTELHICADAFWVRLALFADMGFADSYLVGEVDCPDLMAFFRIFVLNRQCLANATTWVSSISSSLNGLLRRANNLSNALHNVSAHYDISNEMFAAFLSPDMTYSCPIWRLGPSSVGKKESLEEAQIRKLDRCIDNARIKSSDHVLEIGTGWGSFAIRAAERTGCRVTSLTLSWEQKQLAEKRIAALGFTENIEVLLCDYRSLPVPTTGLYDKIVSIEMLEAVGSEFLATYFACVDRLLKPEGGIAVFQCITMPEGRYEAYRQGEDFIRKYIFPGGHLPTITQLVSSIAQGAQCRLIVESIENIGGHYAKTLRIWRNSFMQNFDATIRPALLAEHRGMTNSDVDLFRRKWEYYFTYCEAGFNTKTLGDMIITVGREGATELLEGIPL